MRALLVLMLALPAYVVVAQQRPARDVADAPVRMIRGQVRSGDDSAALLRRARIVVIGDSAQPVFTNEDGRFEIAVPESASYTVSITKAGFAPQHIPASVARAVDQLEVRLPRGAAIVGRVVDDSGGAVVAVAVRVRRMPDAAEPAGVPVNATIHTDDLGEFRVGSLPAGVYEVFVENNGMRVTGTAVPEIQTARTDGDIIGGGGGLVFVARDAVLQDPAGATSQQVSVRLRAGDEIAVALFHPGATAEVRSAAAYVSGYEAGAQAALSETRRAQSRGTGVITGRILGPEGRGVPGAIVRLTPASSGTPRVAASNLEGQFQLTGLPGGAYRVSATKNGFIAGEYGQVRAAQPGRVVTLRDRQRVDRIDIALLPGAVVTGTVTDPDGEPLEGLAMHVWRLQYGDGRPVTEAVATVRRTDDRGRYRLHGLQPGTYYVVAADDTSGVTAIAQAMRGPRTFYPGVPTIAEATPVDLDAGLDGVGIDMTFRPAPTVRVTGFALDSSGVPVNRPVTLVGSTRSRVPAFPAQTSVVGPDGAFEFPHVPRGEYVIQAMRAPSREFAMQFLTVGDRDVGPVRLTTTVGSTVTGRIVIEAGSAAGAVSPIWFDVVAADPDYVPAGGNPRPWGVRINEITRTFEITGLTGPVRFVSTPAAPPGLWLKSVEFRGRNVADEPVVFERRDDSGAQVDVVFSGAGADVSGRVVDGRNEPVASYVAIAFPVDRARWYARSRYIRIARPDEEARFSLGMLPPGEYWIAAVDALVDASIQDPEVLIRLSTVGRRVDLSAGQHIITDLPLARLPR